MKISVAMCTYNGASFLAEQLNSIATQTHPPHELIVVDDSSDDESVKIVESFATSVPFPVELHANAGNLGSTRSFERAISLCNGELIALCDQDDVWLPDKLARFAAEFARAPELGLAFSDAEVVDEDLRPSGYSLWEKLNFGREERERLQRGKGFDALLQGATVTGATAVFRARFKSLVLPIPAELPLIHDAWIAVLIAAVSRVLPLPERLIKYRRHRGQQVGALERLGHTSGSVQQALERENPYAEMLAIARAVQRRLGERQEEFDSSNVRAGLEAKIVHLSARSGLPNGRLPRAPRVFRELLTGRYHRHSSGFSSAAKDLLK